MTRVKFIIFQEELIAVFPDEQFNHWNTKTCMCYARIGQHGEISRSSMKCKSARKEQYSELLRELERIGYDDLKIMNKE